MGIRRSLIITAFSFAEVVFYIELLYIFRSTLTEVESWNRKYFARDERIESILDCGNEVASKNSTCCNKTIFDHSKFAKAFEALRSHRRPNGEISLAMVPLVLGMSVLVISLIIEFPFVQLRLSTLSLTSKTIQGLFRMLHMVSLLAWTVEAAVCIYVAMIALNVRSKLAPEMYGFYDACKTEGQKVDFTKDETFCFHRLNACPDVQEVSMTSAIILLESIILCVVSKFNFRFCLSSKDNDRLDCQHGQRPCSFSFQSCPWCPSFKKTTYKNEEQKPLGKGSMVDSVISLNIYDFVDEETTDDRIQAK